MIAFRPPSSSTSVAGCRLTAMAPLSHAQVLLRALAPPAGTAVPPAGPAEFRGLVAWLEDLKVGLLVLHRAAPGPFRGLSIVGSPGCGVRGLWAIE